MASMTLIHVVKALNDVLDVIRKTLRREHADQDNFKRLQWIVFKRPEHLTDEQVQALALAFDESDTRTVH